MLFEIRWKYFNETDSLVVVDSRAWNMFLFIHVVMLKYYIILQHYIYQSLKPQNQENNVSLSNLGTRFS